MNATSRRRFIADSGKAALAGSIVLMPAMAENKRMKNIFVHHVYFWLRNPGVKKDVDQLVAGLEKLSSVATIRQFHIGKPADTKREVIDSSYSVSWLVFFDNGADQASYQTDPIHLKFVEECSHLWEKVVVYDTVDV